MMSHECNYKFHFGYERSKILNFRNLKSSNGPICLEKFDDFVFGSISNYELQMLIQNQHSIQFGLKKYIF